ncbi:glycosyl transferase [Rhodobacterales bacterium 52_120_T64]|nr:glycosyl transferase [Rhodobacterales bacterium 52_120_T64]
MAKICFLLLCHRNPDLIVEQAEMLCDSGDYVSIHFDGGGSHADFSIVKDAFKNNPNVCLAARVKCGWGEWSLVQGSLNALRLGHKTFPEATHFYMLSGDCMPIKPIKHMHQFLDDSGKDYIEHHDYFESDWIKVGLKEERLIYRHWFNERNNKALFYASIKTQRALGLARDLPKGLQVMIGSQWWCLRRSTITKLLKFLTERPDISRFFKTTWIPDETFFQTLVMHLVARSEVESKTLTFLSFSDYGIPTVFYEDHLNFLLSQDYLFARKISPQAVGLKKSLAEEFRDGNCANIGPDGKRLINYLNARGRTGHRYGERFWERGGRIGRQNTLQIVLCKKWHVGKRVAEAVAKADNVRSLGYIFDESGINLPDLGHLEDTRVKRNRHRRAFLKLLFERLETDNLTICLDPSNLETVADFADDRCQMRVLDVRCRLDDSYLAGHAQRIGLADGNISAEMSRSLTSALHSNIRSDQDSLQEMGLSALYMIAETASEEANGVALAYFMKISTQRAEKIAQSLSFE